jgi:transposase
MRRFELTDEQFHRNEHLLPGKASDPGATARDNRLFMDALLWIARTGAPWPDLSDRFGKFDTVYQRFNRWAKSGVLARVMVVLSDDADLENLLIDSTVVRAHQHAAEPKKRGKRRSGAGPISGRLRNQGLHRRRCVGQPGAVDPHRRPGRCGDPGRGTDR